MDKIPSIVLSTTYHLWKYCLLYLLSLLALRLILLSKVSGLGWGFGVYLKEISFSGD